MRAIVIFMFILTSCSFPKDSNDSLTKAKQHGLQVGIVHNPPFTIYTDGKASGTEVGLIEKFAAKEGLNVDYTYGSESILVKKMEDYKLHLILGGFEKETVWAQKAGITTRYNDKNVLLIARGENELLYKLEAVLLKEKQNGN